MKSWLRNLFRSSQWVSTGARRTRMLRLLPRGFARVKHEWEEMDLNSPDERVRWRSFCYTTPASSVYEHDDPRADGVAP